MAVAYENSIITATNGATFDPDNVTDTAYRDLHVDVKRDRGNLDDPILAKLDGQRRSSLLLS